MIEKLGCELEQVWLTLALASMPLLLILAVPEGLRGFLIIFVVLSFLVPFAPYMVEVKESGLNVISIFITTSFDWKDVVSVRYNNTFKLMNIRTDKHYIVIPFGIWFHTRAAESHFMLLDYVNKNVDPERIEQAHLI